MCYGPLPPSDLRRDQYFQGILEYVGDEESDDDIKVEINEDGSFQKSHLVPIPDANDETKPESQSQDLTNTPGPPTGGSFINLLDSDSEGGNTPPASPLISMVPPPGPFELSRPAPTGRTEAEHVQAYVLFSDSEEEESPWA